MKKTILLFSMLVPFCMISQNITSITPNQASQGQTIPLMISGNNTDFSGWSCSGNWGSISDFRFFQSGGINMMNGTPTTSSINLLNGTLTIPQFQPIGAYTLEVFDGNSCSWLQLAFGFQVNLETSTLFENIKKLTVFPNPSQDVFSIQFKNLIVQDIKINIINNIGELVFSENLIGHIGAYNKKIDLKENAKGIYFLEIETDNGIINKKLILQ